LAFGNSTIVEHFLPFGNGTISRVKLKLKTIKLKASGETITFIKTGKDTDGAFTEVICTLPAGQKGPPRHIHPLQDEDFGVIEGKLELSADGKQIILEQGQNFNVTANTAHTFFNPCDTEIKFRAIYKPSLNIDYFLVQSFDVLNKLSNPKKPNLQTIVDFDYIINQIPGQFLLVGLPTFVLNISAAICKVFKTPKVKSLKEHNGSFWME
jgi:quercetin dioxygenase-like cupin family protein